jgi:hypothetical protein
MGIDNAHSLVKKFINSMYNNDVDGMENGIINSDLSL